MSLVEFYRRRLLDVHLCVRLCVRVRRVGVRVFRAVFLGIKAVYGWGCDSTRTRISNSDWLVPKSRLGQACNRFNGRIREPFSVPPTDMTS